MPISDRPTDGWADCLLAIFPGRELVLMLLGVRHRIDGLETKQACCLRQVSVRHRIDGLENC